MKQRNSTDGFVVRRPHRSSLGQPDWRRKKTDIGHERKTGRHGVEVHSGDSTSSTKLHSGKHDGLKENISQSLRAIDDTASKDKHKKKKNKKRRRVAKIVGLIVGLLVVVGIGFVLYKAWQYAGQMLRGDLFGIFQQQELKMDEFGRSNVLILGTTDDDPDHPGGNLTDSMMVVSVDQKKKDVYMFGIPRDLYVQYDRACAPGYAGKINAYFTCIDPGDTEEAQNNRMEGIRGFIGDIFGMDIQYVAHVNTTVIRDAVNAVGGITVNVDSRDPRGVFDASLDWACTEGNPSPEERQRRCPSGHYIDFPNGPNDMDGEKALWFSRARGAIPGYATYGLEESNFDREKNQQLILMALKDKATSTGTLMDVSKMLSLMEAMGNNLRTNVDTKEVRTILNIASEMNNEDMHQLSFVEEDNLLMVTGNQAGQSIVQPAAGLYNYRDIRTFIKQTIYATPVSKEGATVAVLNGGSTAGAAQEQADRLEELGMNVVYTGNTPESNFNGYTVHAAGAAETNPATREKLAGLYGVSLTQGSPSFGLSVEADFVVIVGNSGS